jgi:hypothetical protein
MPSDGLLEAAMFRVHDSKLTTCSRHADLIAEPLVDVECLLVAAFGLCVVRPFLGEGAELLVAADHADLVIEPLKDVECLVVAAFSLCAISPFLGAAYVDNLPSYGYIFLVLLGHLISFLVSVARRGA